MTLKLIVDSPTDYPIGTQLSVTGYEENKLILEVSEGSQKEPKNVILGMFADKPETMDKVSAAIKELREARKAPRKKRKMSEILAGYSGGLFKDAQEVDEFLKAERESWER